MIDVRSSWRIENGYVLEPLAAVPKKRGTQTRQAKVETRRELARRIDERRRHR